MEYLDRGDLHGYLNRTFPESEAFAITRQLLEGLSFMHEAGFAHSDLKPKNILVQTPGPHWWIKIGDFGISKRIRDSSGLKTAIGTEDYMAPEVKGIFPKAVMGAPSYTVAVDIWAVGLIAWRMITNGV
ncbi:uncharacterized protein DNG_04606 [Cephalotrichum gorgonifer]|uniref:Protein kinase domain-containing protein n=1 Tax=Cephalotrichum gorgonifer TaxID=2041049 RepID=A0AAE8SUQ1_9PEZI|nr:uncharacterized protein DNG_04606 [Cephalotrichum gorgonifer]